MKKKINLTVLLFLLLGLFIFESCSKNFVEFRNEMRIEGTWTIDKVTEINGLSRENISSGFEGDQLEFREDKTALYTLSNGDTKEGVWELEIAHQGEEAIGILALSLVDQKTGTQELMIWSSVRISNQKINAMEDLDESRRNYRLIKL